MPDCRYPEDFPDSQVTEVPYTNTETKSTEEEKSHIPKKVGMALLSLLLLKRVQILFPELLKNVAVYQSFLPAVTSVLENILQNQFKS